jgi:hypothetical protein
VKAVPVLTIAAAALLATALPAAADVQPQVAAAVDVQSPAHLEARGAAVTVPVVVTCAEGAGGSLTVQVTQNVRGEIAAGDKYVPVPTCTGTPQRFSVTLTSRTKAFRHGAAYATAALYVYLPPDQSGGAQDEGAITVQR